MKKLLLLSYLLVTIQFGLAQEELRYNLSVGDQFTLLQNAIQEITQATPDGEQVINNEISGTLFFNVVDVTPEIYSIELSFKNFKLSVSSPTVGEMMKIDTSDEETSAESGMFKGMLNKPVLLRMKPTGEITNIENGNAMLDGLIEGMGEIGEEMEAMMRKQLAKEWSPETLSKSFEQMTFIYPSEAKRISGSWKNEYTGEGKIQAQNTWTFKEKSKERKLLSATATVQMNLSTPALQMNLEGTQESTAAVDAITGFIRIMEVKGISSGDATIPRSPGIKIPTTIKSTTTYILQ